MSRQTVATMIVAIGIGAASGRAIVAEYQGRKTTVVFVCEHGAARSVIAAAYFNKLARERQLPYRAVARGTSPQADLSAATVKGLEADGVPFDLEKPTGLTEADANGAVRIVAFCPMPKAFSRTVRLDEHDDVPDISRDYAAARDRIVAYVQRVIDELERGQ